MAESLTGAQLRAQLAENAISVGKMAAALSHEMNSPLGSASQFHRDPHEVTDRQMSRRRTGERLALSEARTWAHGTRGRGTHRGGVPPFAPLRQPGRGGIEIRGHQRTGVGRSCSTRRSCSKEASTWSSTWSALPPLTCRPQLLRAVFSNLLSNAIHAVNGDGRITLRTRGRTSRWK